MKITARPLIPNPVRHAAVRRRFFFGGSSTAAGLLRPTFSRPMRSRKRKSAAVVQLRRRVTRDWIVLDAAFSAG